MEKAYYEYKDKHNKESSIPVGYTKYSKGYQDHTIVFQLTSHLKHKPGDAVEVDWSGLTMTYIVRTTGEVITFYLFVGTLPYSQYSYVEPCLDMKQHTWLRCHVYINEYFKDRTSNRILADSKLNITGLSTRYDRYHWSEIIIQRFGEKCTPIPNVKRL